VTDGRRDGPAGGRGWAERRLPPRERYPSAGHSKAPAAPRAPAEIDEFFVAEDETPLASPAKSQACQRHRPPRLMISTSEPRRSRWAAVPDESAGAWRLPPAPRPPVAAAQADDFFLRGGAVDASHRSAPPPVAVAAPAPPRVAPPRAVAGPSPAQAAPAAAAPSAPPRPRLPSPSPGGTLSGRQRYLRAKTPRTERKPALS